MGSGSEPCTTWVIVGADEGAVALSATYPMDIEGKTRGALSALAREAATTKGWSIRSATRNAPAGPASLLW